MRWAVGLTTIPTRRLDLLPQTLASLKAAGFSDLRLFVDSCTHCVAHDYEKEFGLPVTARYPNIRIHGNFYLAAGELLVREPMADRYLIAQDDFETYRNLRAYLEKSPYPERGYLNLYTFPSNESYVPMEGQTGRRKYGWHESRPLNAGSTLQTGRGAVALVFNRDAILTLLASQHMVERPLDAHRGWRAVDGGVVAAMNKAGWREHIHLPSLVQHTGEVSSMGNKPHKQSETFRGEDYDALELLKEVG